MSLLTSEATMFETEVGDEIAVTGVGDPAEYMPTPALVIAAILRV